MLPCRKLPSQLEAIASRWLCYDKQIIGLCQAKNRAKALRKSGESIEKVGRKHWESHLTPTVPHVHNGRCETTCCWGSPLFWLAFRTIFTRFSGCYYHNIAEQIFWVWMREDAARRPPSYFYGLILRKKPTPKRHRLYDISIVEQGFGPCYVKHTFS